VSNSPPPPGTPSPPLVQLICAACGIKFASMDNLVAHQAFYCPKRPEPQEHHTRCSKCKVNSGRVRKNGGRDFLYLRNVSRSRMIKDGSFTEISTIRDIFRHVPRDI
jgi:hypothetical protein